MMVTNQRSALEIFSEYFVFIKNIGMKCVELNQNGVTSDRV